MYSETSPIKDVLKKGLILFIWISVISLPAFCQNTAEGNILVLHSYHKGFLWTENLTQGIESTFSLEAPKVSLYHEYMDAKRFKFDSIKNPFIQKLQQKYSSGYLDLVIVTDDIALQFARQYKDLLFLGIPIVFCGVSDFKAIDFFHNSEVTGIVEDHSVKGSIDLILKLLPETKTIFVINDETLTGQILHQKYERVKIEYRGTLTFKDKIGIPKQDLINTLENLPPQSAVLLFSYYLDQKGNTYTQKDLLSFIGKSKHPIFSYWKSYMGKGILANQSIDPVLHGAKAAQMALKALKKGGVHKIPIELKSTTITLIDDEQRIRFGIDENRLPPYSRIINRSKEQSYLPYAAPVVLIFALLLFLIFSNKRCKKKKKSPQKKSSLYESFFQKGNEALYILDAQGTVVDVNLKGAENLGYALKELIGENISKIDTTLENSIKFQELYENFGDSQPLVWESKQIRKDGSMFPVNFRTSFFTHENTPFTLCQVEDLSLEHQNVNPHQINPNFQQNLLKNLPGLVLQLRQNRQGVMRFDFISSRASYLFNLSMQSETPLEDLIQTLHTEERPLFESSIKYAVEKQVEWVFEKRFQTLQNITQWYQGALSSMQEKEDIIFTIVMLETTEKRTAEKALEQTEKTYQELFNSMQDCLLVLDLKGNLIDLNLATCRQFGYLREELIGKSCSILLPAETCQNLLLNAQKEVNENQPYLIQEMGSKKDGSRFDVEVEARKVKIKGEEFILAIIHDISDLIKGEKERKKLETQMFRLQRIEAIGTLAGGIAHDFNNILSPILGYTEMALEEIPKDSEANEYLASVFEAGLRAKDLIKQILAFSRDTGHALKPVKIQPIIKEVTKLSRATIPSTIEIEQDIDPQCGLVMADPVQVHQILMNLFTNASHAMNQNGGTLKICLNEATLSDKDTKEKELISGKYVKLSISDTGIGMSKEVMDHVFDPYFSTKEKDKGAGLGLSVVHGIVKNYGGKISVYSEVGVGTVFKIYLPLISETEAKHSPENLNDFKATHNEKVLIVDDEASIVKLEKNIVASLGYQVVTFSNSSAALKELQANHAEYHIVLTDMTMPEVTGLDIARAVKALSKNLKVVLCTGFSDQLQGKKIEELPIDGLIMKPLVRLELAKALKNVL